MSQAIEYVATFILWVLSAFVAVGFSAYVFSAINAYRRENGHPCCFCQKPHLKDQGHCDRELCPPPIGPDRRLDQLWRISNEMLEVVPPDDDRESCAALCDLAAEFSREMSRLDPGRTEIVL